ncbi:uncharacterized protein LOC111242345 [Vigna radiata var. radiata]|uniref:Uncharacterized protein LOC111242345 n=1 Tax=Vigna radiata var. radiata TaxID=3916 RepID=A0A3Q0FAM3_VIGRR|nr:uncharacterized protein LOC111242345 [Vigna radiata var. radiata]
MKTIHTEFGDIIDCIDIYKQPSFDHPLLKDHKLQRKPNFHNVIGEPRLKTTSIFRLSKDDCPKGTVPILRTTKDDFIREKSMLNNHILTKDVPGVHVAEVSPKPHFGPYYGIRGTNTIYNPRVDENYQISMSHLWVQNGPTQLANKISLGWHVSPELYNDYGTHLYSSWTSDNFKKTGCYNIRCAGFIQIHKDHYLGVRFPNVSRYGGPTIMDLFDIIQVIIIFYIIFTTVKDRADEVGWGGRTGTRVDTRSPVMGAGYPNDDNATHACFFKHVVIQDSSRNSREMIHPSDTRFFIDRPNCYNVRYPDYYYGTFLFFGGPGGYCGN